MTIFQAVLLELVQGLTKFLPVIGAMLLATSVLLFLAGRVQRNGRGEAQTNRVDALLAGVAQELPSPRRCRAAAGRRWSNPPPARICCLLPAGRRCYHAVQSANLIRFEILL